MPIIRAAESVDLALGTFAMDVDELQAALSGQVDDALLRHMLEGLFSVPHVAIWVKDRSLRYVYVTPAWERASGLRHEAVIGRSDADFRAPDVAARFAVVDRRILSGGGPETSEERFVTPTGVRTFASTKFPIRDRSGRVVAVAGVSTETTDFASLPATSRTDGGLVASVLETLPEEIVRFTPDLTVTFANAAFTAAWAGSDITVVGAGLGSLLGPLLRARFVAALSELSPRVTETEFEQEWYRYDGRPRWRRWRLSATLDPAGRIAVVQAIASDVTTQKRYQKALESLLSASRRPDASLASVLDGILATGIDYFELDAGAVVEFRGGRPGAIRVAGRPGTDAPSADDFAGLVAGLPLQEIEPRLVADARTGGGDTPVGAYVCQRIRLADGALGAVVFIGPRARAHPFARQAPLVQRLIAQWVETAMERDRRLAEVTRNRAELSLILETVPAQVLSLDAAGAVITANAAARSADRPAESRSSDSEALAGGAPVYGVVERWEDPDGGIRWMRTDRVPFDDALTHEARLLVVANDVTETVEKERALASANEGLKQFTYVASHDLQEPLRKIGTFVDILTEGLQSGNAEDIAYATRVIRESARRASALIKDLLSWSRLSNRPPERQPVRWAALVREVVADIVAGRPGEAVEIVDEMADLVVPADPTHVRQLVENLVVNALKYRHPDRIPVVTLRLRRDGPRRALFEVADNGIGFDPKYARQIFEPFRRLHSERDYTGTGVGLAICARVCESHGWDIAAAGEPGAGATFRVTLAPAGDVRPPVIP